MRSEIAARTIPLRADGLEKLTFDYTDGLYRVAYYKPKLDVRYKQVGELRFAAKHKNLHDALNIVLGEGESRDDPLTVEASA